MNADDETVEITARLLSSTDDAFKIHDGDRAVWVPRSKATNNRDGTFTMPVWLAKDRGLV